MNFLYAPWRGSYTGPNSHSSGCIFCEHAKNISKDEKNFVLYRGKFNYIMLNLYPYNTGHMLIIPFAHGPYLKDINEKTRNELMELTFKASEILRNHLQAEGFNIGSNIGGKVAGGSVPDHLHMHVIPRWEGDTSFLVSISDTKPISHDFTSVYNQLLPFFKELT